MDRLLRTAATHHDALVPRTTHNGGENGAGGVIPSKSGLDHARAIVAHDGADLTVLCKQGNGRKHSISWSQTSISSRFHNRPPDAASG